MKPRCMLWSIAGLMVANLLNVVSAPAAVVTVAATDAGFVTAMGGSAKGDSTIAPPAKYNYSAGRELHYADGSLGMPPGTTPLMAMDRKNYFVFDLSAVTGTITSATLKLYAGPAVAPPFPGGMHGYESVHPTETYGIAATMDSAGALSDISALAMSSFAGDFDSPMDPLVGMAKSLYTKLADGMTPLAFIMLSPADDGTTVSLPFTPAGLGYLNSFLGSDVVLGGLVPSAMPPDSPQSVFGFTGPDIPGGDPLTPMLEITFIPEPSAGLLALVALLGVGVFRGRQPQA
jgi:hypothetical protein